MPFMAVNTTAYPFVVVKQGILSPTLFGLLVLYNLIGEMSMLIVVLIVMMMVIVMLVEAPPPWMFVGSRFTVMFVLIW